jgi:serine/threonine protein kinase
MGNSSKKKLLLEEIDRNELEIGDLITVRRLASLSSGLWSHQNSISKVTVKTFDEDGKSKEIFRHECEILADLNHTNIIRILGVCSVDKPYRIVFEPVNAEIFLDYLRSRSTPYLQINGTLTKFAAQIASGMNYLHEKHAMIHCDLAARNVLISENFELQVWNFGRAKKLGDREFIVSTDEYAIKWAAPEIIEHGKYSKKSDIWAFGILLMELFTYGRIPFFGKSDDEIRQVISERNYLNTDLKSPYPLPYEIYCKMTNCWKIDPDKRPTFEQLRDFFDKYEVRRHKSFFCGDYNKKDS